MQTCKHLYAQNTGRFELSGQFTLLTWTCDSYKRVTVEGKWGTGCTVVCGTQVFRRVGSQWPVQWNKLSVCGPVGSVACTRMLQTHLPYVEDRL